jgi:hypothetical protein
MENNMDLKQLAVSTDGVWYNNVAFLDGSPTDLCFQVVGKNSDQFKKVERKFSKEFIMDKKKAANELESQQVDVLCACVIAWKNVSEGETALVCNYDNKKRIFSDPAYYWLVNAIDRFIGEDTNFLSQKQLGKS